MLLPEVLAHEVPVRGISLSTCVCVCAYTCTRPNIHRSEIPWLTEVSNGFVLCYFYAQGETSPHLLSLIRNDRRKPGVMALGAVFRFSFSSLPERKRRVSRSHFLVNFAFSGAPQTLSRSQCPPFPSRFFKTTISLTFN